MIAERLKFGDTIGLVSPAGADNPDSIKKSISFFKSLGFNIKEGEHIYDKYGYFAGNDKDRAEDFTNMFLDEDIDMVLCIRGGYGAMRILPLIDFNVIRENPKIFAGFSDITTLLNTISSKCNLVTFHSPMFNSNFSDKITLESFLYSIMNAYNPYDIKNPEGFNTECFSNVPSITGELVGGNLALISSTLGTPYEIDTKNKILFIEDVSEEPYRIDRMLTQLILSGKLQQCRGFILGQFTNCSLPHYERSLTLKEVIEDRILSLNKPTVLNFQSGHSYPKLTLPIGAQIKLDCKSGIIHVLHGVIN
ncbi:LD-carboxypeptidase [Clostridium sp. P21]|uniref:LD-carboxypeptidase n=1 Tax=Clostridium muellerianum TaxID=2716538 RepID=A0A7Y0HL85_9CLOT|nr:LD-carboxypeptidase [Clostridium muellerianum]NMM61649.1 LD-carboxypeptidase [Clostridium muellerianum]